MNQKRTLVLMPGLDGTGRLFEPIIPLLKPHFDLTIITYPDLDSLDDYVDCAQQQLPSTSGFSLLAESFSGPVALVLMSRHREMIGPSVLCATFARSPLAELTRMANYIPDSMFSIGALSKFSQDVYAIDGEDLSETQPLPLNVTEQLDGAVLKHRCKVLSRIDVSALLPSIDVPILYLHGQRDRIVSENQALLLQQSLPNMVKIDIDAPHLILQTRPQLCAGLVFKHIYAVQRAAADS